MNVNVYASCTVLCCAKHIQYYCVTKSSPGKNVTIIIFAYLLFAHTVEPLLKYMYIELLSNKKP